VQDLSGRPRPPRVHRHAGARRGKPYVICGGTARHSEVQGPAYLQELLEPFLQAAEQLLVELVRRGRLKPLEPRGAALALLAPILFALIHQDHLGGRGQRPLDVTAFARSHAAMILRGIGETAPGRETPKPGRYRRVRASQ
jgi:hypothetical protein